MCPQDVTFLPLVVDIGLKQTLRPVTHRVDGVLQYLGAVFVIPVRPRHKPLVSTMFEIYAPSH